MKRKVKIILVSVLFFILLIPIPLRYKDGGSVRFKAILYDVTRYHRLDLNSEEEYRDGLKIKIMGITIYNNFEE